MAGPATPATALLTRHQVSHTVHRYQVDAAAARSRGVSYGEAVAAALGVDPARVFKTLVTSVQGRLTVGVLPVSATLDLKALAGAVEGRRAVLAEAAAAERATGYVTGGISPLGQRSRLPTVLDTSVEGWPTILISAGRRGLQIELAPVDLIRLTQATVAPIVRKP